MNVNLRGSQFVCRTCLKIINENELYLTADANTEYGKVIDILETCVSELNLDLTNDVVLCDDCSTLLRVSYSFKLKCLHTEDKVFAYLQNNHLQLYNKINLTEVINNMTNMNIESNNYQTHVKEILSNDDTNIPSRAGDVASNFLKKNEETSGTENGILEKRTEITDINENENWEETDTNNRNNDVVMFEDMTKSENLSFQIETDDYQKQEDLSPQNNNDNEYYMSQNSDWELQERCRLNSCKGEYSESLFRRTALCDDDEFENFIFRAPSTYN